MKMVNLMKYLKINFPTNLRLFFLTAVPSENSTNAESNLLWKYDIPSDLADLK